MIKFPPFDCLMGQIWREKCGIRNADYEKSPFICHNHFSSSDMGSKFLKKHAEPTLLLGGKDTPERHEFENIEINGQNFESSASPPNLKNWKLIDFYTKKYYKLLAKYNKIKLANKKGSVLQIK